MLWEVVFTNLKELKVFFPGKETKLDIALFLYSKNQLRTKLSDQEGFIKYFPFENSSFKCYLNTSLYAGEHNEIKFFLSSYSSDFLLDKVRRTKKYIIGLGKVLSKRILLGNLDLELVVSTFQSCLCHHSGISELFNYLMLHEMKFRTLKYGTSNDIFKLHLEINAVASLNCYNIYMYGNLDDFIAAKVMLLAESNIDTFTDLCFIYTFYGVERLRECISYLVKIGCNCLNVWECNDAHLIHFGCSSGCDKSLEHVLTALALVCNPLKLFNTIQSDQYKEWFKNYYNQV